MAILGLGRAPANVAGGFAGTTTTLPRTPIGTGVTSGTKAAAGPSAADKAQAAWDEAMKLLLREGPLNAGVQQQMVNRRADQSAAAEAVNAEQLRNEAAARGLDPTQALRQQQQQRQASNLAFSGDLRSQAAVQNFAAETPGRMAAANANLNRSFTGASTPAVTGGGMSISQPAARSPMPVVRPPTQPMAFSGGATTPRQATAPQTTMSVADRNAAQAAWNQQTNNGRLVYGANYQAGMSGTGRNAQGNLINATPLARTTTTGQNELAFTNARYGAAQRLPY